MVDREIYVCKNRGQSADRITSECWTGQNFLLPQRLNEIELFECYSHFFLVLFELWFFFGVMDLPASQIVVVDDSFEDVDSLKPTFMLDQTLRDIDFDPDDK